MLDASNCLKHFEIRLSIRETVSSSRRRFLERQGGVQETGIEEAELGIEEAELGGEAAGGEGMSEYERDVTLRRDDMMMNKRS